MYSFRWSGALLGSLASLLLGVLVVLQPLWLDAQFVPQAFYGIELFAILAVMGLSSIWVERSLVQPYVLLLCTLALFIGGRFIGVLLIDAPIFRDNYYVRLALSAAEQMQLMSRIGGGLLMMHGGYLAVHALEANGALRLPRDAAHRWLTWPALAALLVSAAVAAIGIRQAYAACMASGYMAIYQNQATDNLLRLGAIGQYGLLLGAGLAFATGRAWLKGLAVALVAAYFLAYLGVGVRGGFLALVLMGTWLAYARIRRMRLLVLLVVPVLMFALAQLSLATGCRTLSEAGEPTPTRESVESSESREGGAARSESRRDFQMEHYAKLLRLEQAGWFLYLQGTTLVYTGAAMRLDDYPPGAYLQSLVPGYSRVAQRLGLGSDNADFYFPHHLAKHYSEERYAAGYGMGWSLFSDLHAFSRGNTVLYCLLALLIGAGLAYLSRAAQVGFFFQGALICVFLKLMLLPRAGLYSIAPYLVTYTALFLAAYCAMCVWRWVFRRSGAAA